jgi:hypothetical protein
MASDVPTDMVPYLVRMAILLEWWDQALYGLTSHAALERLAALEAVTQLTPPPALEVLHHTVVDVMVALGTVCNARESHVDAAMAAAQAAADQFEAALTEVVQALPKPRIRVVNH